MVDIGPPILRPAIPFEHHRIHYADQSYTLVYRDESDPAPKWYLESNGNHLAFNVDWLTLCLRRLPILNS
jgi:hypothetical protein